MDTILVVDDMAIIRELLAFTLGSAGYRALSASDGIDALVILQAQRVDLVVLDLSMPKMNGYEVLRRMRANPATATIPVVLLTVTGDRRLVMEAAKLGVRDYVLKSAFDMAQLLARIGGLLANRAIVGAAVPAGATAQAPAPEAESDRPLGSLDREASASARREPDSLNASARATNVLSTVGMRTSVDPARAAADLNLLKPLVTRSGVEEQLARLGEIKPLCPNAARVLQLANSDRTSLEDIVQAVRLDQAISLKILMLANSAVYTRGAPVESVHKAVMRIGLSQIRQAVLNISVMDRFADSQGDAELSAPQFWEHSIACGLIAAEITHSRGGSVQQSDSAFTMGLLHDVGRMIYAERMPEHYRSVLAVAQELQLPLELVESRLLLLNHAQLMEHVLQQWRFPKQFIKPIALHHHSLAGIRQAAPAMVDQVAILVLANRLAHALLLGSSGNQSLYPTQELAGHLRIGAKVFAKIASDIPDQTQDIKLAMLRRSKDKAWQPRAAQVREQIGVPLRPVFIGAAPALDGLALLVQQLRSGEPADQPANLAIVHLAHPSERAAATAQFKRAEDQTGGASLGLVVLSPEGKLSLEQTAIGQRRSAMLPCPVMLGQFIDAVCRVLGRGESNSDFP